MDWLIGKLNSIPEDKMRHYAVCFTMMIFLRKFLPRLVSAAIVLAFSLWKEVRDKVTGKGQADWWDLVADLAGIAMGMI